MTDIAVVLVNWNGCADLRAALRSLYNAPPACEYEVWVVDNASTDGSAEMVWAEFPQAQLVVNPVNEGFSRANNAALSGHHEPVRAAAQLGRRRASGRDRCHDRLYGRDTPARAFLAPKCSIPTAVCNCRAAASRHSARAFSATRYWAACFPATSMRAIISCRTLTTQASGAWTGFRGARCCCGGS